MTTDYTPNFQLALPDFRMGPWHDLINDNLKKLDALLYSAVSQGNVDVWANATHYTVGITVLDGNDATVWMCAVTHTSSAEPVTFVEDRANNPTYWTRLLTGFAPRGEWAQSTQYFPYDLTYDSAQGIMALCTIKHISTATGSIIHDKAFWAFLLDMSDVNAVIASAVSYSNTASGIPNTNVQGAIDYVETQIHALDSVNLAQGTAITTINSDIAKLRTDMTTGDAANNDAMMKLTGNQIVSGGFRFTSFDMGNGSGNVLPDPMKGNYQYIGNVGAFTLLPPVNDCAMDILVINGAAPGGIAFSGYTIGPNTGDSLTVSAGHRFIISIRRINNVSTYVIKALQ